MKLVSIQSPYAGNINRNTEYAWRALHHSIMLGEAPFASHLLYGLLLDDSNPHEREMGISRDHAFLAKCDLVAFYHDYGFSPGMIEAQTLAITLNIPTAIRHIGTK